jgi:hypothetical protein
MLQSLASPWLVKINLTSQILGGNLRKIDYHWPLRNPLLFHGRILRYGYYHWTPHNTLLVYGGNARSGLVTGPSLQVRPIAAA